MTIRSDWRALTIPALMLLAATSPKGNLQWFALIAVAIAFLSASQDVAYDAYRTEVLPARERVKVLLEFLGREQVIEVDLFSLLLPRKPLP